MSLPDFLDVIFKGPEEKLNSTVYTQPALLTASYAIYRVMEDLGFPEPDYTAGHSLGELTALLVAGGLELNGAVHLTYDRAKFMQSAVPEGRGAMAAFLKISPEEVEEVCRIAREAGVVEPANYNSPVQTVVSGEREAVERAGEIARHRGARVCSPDSERHSHGTHLRAGNQGESLQTALFPRKVVSECRVHGIPRSRYLCGGGTKKRSH